MQSAPDADDVGMANRPTMRELAEERTRHQRAEMQEAIDDGRLTVRQMTPQERKAADARRAAAGAERAARTSGR